jgi:pimeloyl-ACP methyl ester carboxylesterase
MAPGRMIESLQGRLIFGRTTRIRPLQAGPHAASYRRTAHCLERPGGVMLEGWSSTPVEGSTGGVVLYFGGRNENVTWAADMASFNPRHAIYAFNYRGFGGSTGRPSERRATSDACAIHDFIVSRESTAALTIIGRSLGTAIALSLAREARPGQLVLMSPFESVAEVLRMRPLGRVGSRLVTQRFECVDAAAAHAGATLVLLAERDTSVPHAQSLRLGGRFPNQPTVHVVQGTTHQSLPRSAGAQAATAQFLAAGAAPIGARDHWSTFMPRSA